MTDAPQTGLALAPDLSPAVLATLRAEAEAAQGYASASHAEATRRAYAADWRAFRAWCEARALPALPAAPAALGLYLAHLAGDGHKVSTIRRAVVAITAHHKAGGLPSPWANAAVHAVLQGIERAQGSRPAKKRAATREILARMAAPIPGDLRGARDRAILLVGWSGAFRRAELCAVRVEHLAWEERGALVLVPRSKTDQSGRGRYKGLHASKDAALCPVRALRAWLEGAGITQGPVFRPVSRWGKLGPRALGPAAVAAIVKHWAGVAGLDPRDFGGHSLRSGFVTSARKAGATLEQVMAVSHHRDVAQVLAYSQESDAFDNAGRLF